MRPWGLEFTRSAERAYAAMPGHDRAALARALDRLTRNPSSVDLQRVQGQPGVWRVRWGAWRAFIEFDQGAHMITVTRIAPRKDAY